MNKSRYSLVATIVACTLAACASVQESAQKVEARASCCKSMAEMHFEHLRKAESQSFTLDDTSPVFSFDIGKSYFKAYTLPTGGKNTKLKVTSNPTGSIGFEPTKLSQVFCPQATFLDENFGTLVSIRRVPTYVRGFGLISEFEIPEPTKYVVLHTNPSIYGALVTRYTLGGGYAVGNNFVFERGGEPIHHPCGPVADASVEVQ